MKEKMTPEEVKKLYPNLKSFPRKEDWTEEDWRKQREKQKKATIAAAEAKKRKAELEREIKRQQLDRNAIIDDALVDLMDEDPDVMKKLNKRLLGVVMHDKASPRDIAGAASLFARLNGLEAPKNQAEQDIKKPKSAKERQEALKKAGVKLVRKDNE